MSVLSILFLRFVIDDLLRRIVMGGDLLDRGALGGQGGDDLADIAVGIGKGADDFQFRAGDLIKT